MISNEDVNQLSSANSPSVPDREGQSEQPELRKRIAFREAPDEYTLLDQMKNESEDGDEPLTSEKPSAIMAESAEIKLSGIPTQFDESFFRSAQLPTDVLKLHASSMTEQEVQRFVNDAARAAGNYGKKLGDIIAFAAPFILREREFYCQQGKRNAQGKTWTERKEELALTFGAKLRTFERALTEMLKIKTMEYNLTVPGVIEELPITFEKDRLPEIEMLVTRCGLLSAPSESSHAVVADSPESLWKIIDGNLNDAIESVFFVDDPREFASRLREFAQAVADNF